MSVPDGVSRFRGLELRTTKAARKGTLRERISVGCFLEKCTIVRKNILQDNAFLQNPEKTKWMHPSALRDASMVVVY